MGVRSHSARGGVLIAAVMALVVAGVTIAAGRARPAAADEPLRPFDLDLPLTCPTLLDSSPPGLDPPLTDLTGTLHVSGALPAALPRGSLFEATFAVSVALDSGLPVRVNTFGISETSRRDVAWAALVPGTGNVRWTISVAARDDTITFPGAQLIVEGPTHEYMGVCTTGGANSLTVAVQVPDPATVRSFDLTSPGDCTLGPASISLTGQVPLSVRPGGTVQLLYDHPSLATTPDSLIIEVSGLAGGTRFFPLQANGSARLEIGPAAASGAIEIRMYRDTYLIHGPTVPPGQTSYTGGCSFPEPRPVLTIPIAGEPVLTTSTTTSTTTTTVPTTVARPPASPLARLLRYLVCLLFRVC